jgi:hypothetical protein
VPVVTIQDSETALRRTWYDEQGLTFVSFVSSWLMTRDLFRDFVFVAPEGVIAVCGFVFRRASTAASSF